MMPLRSPTRCFELLAALHRGGCQASVRLVEAVAARGHLAGSVSPAVNPCPAWVSLVVDRYPARRLRHADRELPGKVPPGGTPRSRWTAEASELPDGGNLPAHYA